LSELGKNKERKPKENLIGKKFHMLEVIKLSDKKNSESRFLWECKCECGKVILLPSNKLTGNGRKQKSCGCIRYNPNSPYNHKLVRVWSGMKSRCNNHKLSSYHNYGARGIKVCKEWDSYLPFYEWAINNGYKEGLELDRINNDGHYEPDNCRFITRKKNSNNRRTNVYETFNGITKTQTEWADEIGISVQAFRQRLKKGLNEEELLEPPDSYYVNKANKRRHKK
jgi:hypothetical protein